jgi:hypothetical protein
MWVAGQWFGAPLVARIAAEVQADATLSRRALARRVCEWLDWRAPTGRLREMSGRKALVELQRRGVVVLPARAPVATPRGPARASAPPEIAEVHGPLVELGEVTVVPVGHRDSAAARVWTALMRTYHPHGAGPLCGAQMRYLVHSARFGWLGALGFSAAARRLKARDAWIGWTEAAHRAHLEQVVCNSRFLLAPSVRVPHLASHVLAKSARRLPQDWQRRYGYAPVLVETFVDGTRWPGTCYRAANWVRVGTTAGRRDGYRNGTRSTGPKAIFVYPLARDWRARLCAVPPAPVRRPPALGPEAGWVEEEFAGACVYDARLRRRLYRLAEAFAAQPGTRIPQACGGTLAASKAAYRFFANPRMDLQTLLAGHVAATAERLAAQAVVLAVQDTTTLNYTAHPATEGLGPINTRKDQGVGLVLHSTLAFTAQGTPLGLLDVQCWARDPAQAGIKRARRNELPVEAKESVKWLHSYRATAAVQALAPQTLLVSVGDREADLHELFWEAQQMAAGPKLLVRAERSRRRQVHGPTAEEHEDLWEKLAAQPIVGDQTLAIPRQGSRLARTATLAVRYAAVTLRPPKRSTAQAVAAWAVYVREMDPPAGTAGLEWMLLTTVPVETVEQAFERLQWYARRWGIEVFHRVLKSGCRIEDRQLQTGDSLQACLALDLVVAWRIYWLVKQGRETPTAPCTVLLEADEWRALYATVRQADPPATPLALRAAVRMIAALGGFIGRPRDEPGTITVWRGLARLDAIVLGFRAARRLYAARDGP